MFIAKPCSAEDNEKPWIIVTDLNTPQMHVLEYLTAVKAHDTSQPAIFRHDVVLPVLSL
jgi:DNA-binding NtrC family response regulator